MDWIDIVKSVIMIIGSGIAAFSDMKHNKIKNNLVFPLFLISVVLNIIQYFIYNQLELLSFAMNTGIVCTISLLLYFLKVWAGGDSKLLIVITLLYPISCYWTIHNSSIPLVYMVGIMFSIGFVYLLVESLFFFIQEKNTLALKDTGKIFLTSLFRYLITLIYISTFSHIYLRFIQSIIEIPQIIYCIICIIMIILLHYFKIFYSKPLIILSLCADIIMTILARNITLNHFWPTYLVVLVFMLMRSFVNRYNYQEIPTQEIRQGMILSRASSMLFRNSRVKGLPGLSDETLKSRLTQTEVDAILRWQKSVHGKDTIIIMRKVPFAVFIFFGMIFYLLGGILIW